MTVLEKLRKRDPRDSKTFRELGRKATRDNGIRNEALALLDHDDKNIRTGAIGTLREVAAVKPQLLVRNLDRIIQALERKERPTRWIAVDILGYCAKLAPDKIDKAFPRIVRHVDPGQGTVLMVQSARFLGHYGTIDKARAGRAFSHLQKAMEVYPDNARGFVLEALTEIAPLLGQKRLATLRTVAESYIKHPKAAVKKKAKKLLNAAARRP